MGIDIKGTSGFFWAVSLPYALFSKVLLFGTSHVFSTYVRGCEKSTMMFDEENVAQTPGVAA
jgi:hypothetical protein